ncbi:MAG: BatD family protein [Chitinispirillales bacterium]|jgi:tetratricopeptide (TPR) repeat protein|nr:BatD family protein [Chitinispirillales bacterium]
MNNRYKNVYTAMLILFAALSSATASVSFTVTTNRTNVAQGERVTVVATLVSPQAVSGIPQVAANDAFDVLGVNTGQSQSYRTQWVNGRTERREEHIYKYIYNIVPKVDGAFTFPALTVNIDGTDHSTRPLNFNSGGAAGGGGGVRGMGGGSGQEPAQVPDLRIFLNISKRTLYPGEQAVLTFKIAQRANTPIQMTQRGYARAIEQIENAFTNGLSINRLFTTQITQGQEYIDGVLHHTFMLQFAVFGMTAGEYSIPGIVFDYDEIRRTGQRRGGSFFGDFFEMDFFGGTQAVQRSARSAPFTVTVRPLPAGAPQGFSGSVGRFTLAASVEPETVQAGEALNLRITLRGNTRPSNVGDPILPELANSDIFTPERQTSVDTGAGGLSTRKTYRYLIVPREAGELTIGPITYPFLDPETGTYRIAQTNPMTVTVTPGRGGSREQVRYLTQEDIQQVGRDIRYIKMPARIAHQEERPYRAPHWYLLFPMPFLIFLFALLYKLQSKRGDENQFKNIRQKALATAVRELGKAGKDGNNNVFLGRAAIVIEKYISHKFAFPATGRTLEELKDELLSRKVDEETVTGLTVLIEGINEYRFGGKAFDTQSRSEIIKRTTSFLSSIEKTAQKSKSPAPSSLSAPLLMALAVSLIMASPAAASTEGDILEITPVALNYDENIPAPAVSLPASGVDINAWFQSANNFYANNQFDSALVYYTRILDAGVKNSAVLYNMGNSHYRLQRPGLARLHYERAAILAPNDPDIQANIDFVKSIIVDRAVETQDDFEFLTAVAYNIHTLLPLNIQLIALCALLFVLSLIAALMLMKKGLARLWLAYAAVLCALLTAVVGVSAGYKIYAIESRQYAIIMTQSLDAKNQPAGTQTLFTVHEGTKLRVNKTVGEWSLVSLPNGASGWVTTASLGRI